MNRCSMLQFALARGIGEVSIKKAIAFIESNNLSWDDFIQDRNLLYHFGLKDNVITNISTTKSQAYALYEELELSGVKILSESDIAYPQYLKKMLQDKCPSILFVSGNIDLLNSIAVGFCGSRKASAKGIGIAADCSRQLTKENITVISGYAAGTDLAAHKSALENGGNTVFVLAEGILRYSKKREIRDYLNSSNHVFISQFMPKTTWNAGNAMRRNSVIIGLSRAMILVESGKTGGTFAAGEEALRVGCPLLVIDFAQPEVSAEANPYFIAAGGKPIRGKNGIPNITKVLDAVKNDPRSETQPLPVNGAQQLKFDI